jgi:hypothetical protein
MYIYTYIYIYIYLYRVALNPKPQPYTLKWDDESDSFSTNACIGVYTQ